MFVFSFITGMGLGGFYFAGLWWTIRRLPYLRTSIYLWVTLSFWIRIGVVLAGFYLVMAGDWRRLLACLAGFTIVRLISVRWVKQRTALPVS